MQPNATNRRLALGGGFVCLALLVGLWLASGEPHAPERAIATSTTTPVPDAVAAPSSPHAVDDLAAEREPADPITDATEARITCVWATDGAPAIGIPVKAHRVEPAGPGMPIASATTNAFGVATFRGLTAEQHEFAALRTKVRAVVAAGRGVEATIRLPQVADVRGIVVDANGTPAGHAVVVAEVGSIPQPVATAGTDGRFHARLPSAGKIWASKEGHGPSRMQEVDADVAHVELRLGTAGGSLTGCVLDPEGAAAPHASVAIAIDLTVGHGHPTTPPVMLTADARGEFATTQVPRARLLVIASAEGFAFGQQETDTTGPDRPRVIVRLRRPATIHGVLLGGDNRTVPQVRWLVHASRNRLLAGLLSGSSGRLTRMFALSDAAGRYRLTGVPPGRVAITTFDARKTPISHNVLLREGQDYEWSPDLAPPSAVIRGTLLGPDGTPLAGVHLRATRFDPVQVQELTSRTESDANGQFELRELRAFPYTLTVHASASAEPFAQRAEVKPDVAPFVWQLQGLPSQTGAIVGRVLDPDGRPLTVATYRATGDGITRRGAATPDPEGGFRIADVVPGTWQILGEGSNYGSFDLGRHTVRAHAQVDLGTHVLPRRGSVLARVRGRDFEPTAIELTLEQLTGGKNKTSEFRPEAGALRSPPLPPGRYRLLTRGANFAPTLRDVDIPADGDVAIDVDVESGTTVAIQFLLEECDDEEWVDYLIFDIRDQRGEVVLKKTLETRTPTTTFPLGLAPGAYTVEAIARMTASREGKMAFVVPAAGTKALDVRVNLDVLHD